MSSQTDDAATGVVWPGRTGVSRTELDPTSFLHRSAAIHPNRVAVVYGDVRRTYAELRERVDRLASALHAWGLEHHDRVAALCPNLPQLLELHHAVPAAGGVLVAINARLSAREVGYILEHSGARVLFVDAELEPLAAEAPAGLEVVQLGDEYARLVASGAPAGVRSRLGDEEQPIAIDYTSGTTGRPKGVVYTYRGAYLNALAELITPSTTTRLPLDTADVPLQRLVLPWAVMAAVAPTCVCGQSIGSSSGACSASKVSPTQRRPPCRRARHHPDAGPFEQPVTALVAGAPPSPRSRAHDGARR